MVIVRVIVVLMVTLVKFPFNTTRVLIFATDLLPAALFLPSMLSSMSLVCLLLSSTFNVENITVWRVFSLVLILIEAEL